MKAQSEVPSSRPQSEPELPLVRFPKKWPAEIRNGDCVVKIYRTPTVVRGKRYQGFTLSYFSGGRRQRRQFSVYAEAKREADRISEQKALGALGAAALSATDRVALEEALTLLGKHEGTSNARVARLVEIVRDYSGARACLPPTATLTEAAQFFSARHPANMPRKAVAEVVAELIADRRSAGCSAIHVRDLVTRLGQFSRAFALPISGVSAPVVQQFIYGMKRGHDSKPVSNRSKENMLRQVVTLFNFARRMKYVSAELAVDITEIPVPKKQPAPIMIYAADEIKSILAAADADIVPALAIAAFGGLRLAEVARLDWKDVRLAERLIVVEAANAKTAARRLAPISDNLAKWLEPNLRPFGPVNPADEVTGGNVGHSLGLRFVRAVARAKVKWVRNGFRHTYISARVATLKDVAAVALECGNSPAIIFSNYRALLTETEGKAWFAVKPT